MPKYRIFLATEHVNVYEVDTDNPWAAGEEVLANPDKFPLVDSYLDGEAEYNGFEMVGDGE